EKDLRSSVVDEPSQRSVVAYVGNLMLGQARCNLALFEEVWSGIRRKAVSVHFGAEFPEPQGQPRTLETHMPGYQHAFAAIKVSKFTGVNGHPRLPNLPRRRARLPHSFKKIFLAQRVHWLPETGVAIGHELSVGGKTLQRS